MQNESWAGDGEGAPGALEQPGKPLGRAVGTLTSMASRSNMRSCRKRSSLTLRSWNSSSIWACASSSCCSTVSMWPMELLWGVLLLEMAESLRGRGRGPGSATQTGTGGEGLTSPDTRSGGSGLQGEESRQEAGLLVSENGIRRPSRKTAWLPPLSGAPRPEDTLEKSGCTSSRSLREI